MAVRRVWATLMLAYAVTAAGAAGQEAEVRSAVNETLATWSAGDFAAFAGFYTADARGFFLDGSVLVEDGIDVSALQAGYDAGIKATFTVRDLNIRMVGSVAVSSAYLDGSLTLPGGAVRDGTWRYTETRVKEGGTWKVIQFHFSDLTAGRR